MLSRVGMSAGHLLDPVDVDSVNLGEGGEDLLRGRAGGKAAGPAVEIRRLRDPRVGLGHDHHRTPLQDADDLLGLQPLGGQLDVRAAVRESEVVGPVGHGLKNRRRTPGPAVRSP